jgi:redox-sensitive bicupin YhaK (pirin superfamily)
MSIRPVKRIVQSQPTIEGAGVKLRRAFGFGDTEETDPFLLLDDFRNDNPQDYLAGFPWHPHRGIETVTYLLEGSVAHGDSLGNRGTLNKGDVQWMTAGRGIMHQEMPQGDAQGRMHGFQLWARSTASPPIRAISTCSCRRASARRFKSKSSATPSLTCSRATASSPIPPSHSAC